MSNIFDKEQNSTNPNPNSAQKQAEFNYSYDQSREPIGANQSENSPNFISQQIQKIKEFMRKNKSEPAQTLDNQEENNSSATKQKVAGFFAGNNAKTKRIIFFIILLILILLLVLWLKSSNNKTVESFEDGSMQFQAFQPINNTDPNPNNFDDSEQSKPEPENKVITIDSNQSIKEVYTINDSKDNGIVIKANPLAQAEEVNQPISTPTDDSKALEKAKAIIQAEALKQKQLQQAKAKTETKVSEKTEKSVAVKPKKQTKTKAANTHNANVKVITIKKGMSLMQAFRNQGLSITDLNSMVHTKGAGKTLNRFQPGDKVRVTTNGKGNIETLTLKSGSSFIRQTNGSYIFLK